MDNLYLKIYSVLIIVFSGFSIHAEDNRNLNWTELSAGYEVPEWYREGKLGIWTHWGPQAFPLQGAGWYARHMYMQNVGREKWGKNAYGYHCRRFGHPSEVGYKDVLHQWKTPRLDTDAILKYAKEKLGAKYFVAMANHHDHFDCWDSSHHPWNSKDIGPKRDLVGEFAASAKKIGMPFGASSHDDRHLSWWKPAFRADVRGPKKGVPYDGNLTKADGKGKWWEGLDPADLYGLPPAKRTAEWIKGVKENWERRHTELIRKYELDYLWFDGHNFPYGEYGRRVAERFYSDSLEDNGNIDVVLAGKPSGMSAQDQKGWVKDFERGVPSDAPGRTFQSITTVRTWFYTRDPSLLKFRQNARTLAEMFSDVLSKGGNLLLNLELTGDGGFPEDLMPIYDAFGDWVRLNSEAIYGSRPWVTNGDNRPKELAARRNLDETDLEQAQGQNAQFNERTTDSPPYPHNEVRFTVRKDKLYIFVLNPDEGPIELPTLGLNSIYRPGQISSIRLLGGGHVEFRQTAEALTLVVPEQRPNDYTAVFEATCPEIAAPQSR